MTRSPEFDLTFIPPSSLSTPRPAGFGAAWRWPALWRRAPARAGARLAVASLVLAVALGGCGGPSEEAAGGGAAPSSDASSADAGFRLPELEYPEPVRDALRAALDAYEEVRARLAGDTTDGVAPRARRLADALAAAEAGLAAAAEAGDAPDGDLARPRQLVAETGRAARGLAEAEGLPAARAAFGEVSRFLIAVVGADPALASGLHVFSCPMEEGFNKWLQPTEEMANPFMGEEMLTCGSRDDWTVRGVASLEELRTHAEHVHGADPADPEAIAHYTCPMHPSIESPNPGDCPICSMPLVPVTRGELASGVVFVDEARRRRIGVTTGRAMRRAMADEIRAVGRVVFDETRLTDVSVKYRGWIGRLHVDEPGQAVRRGEPLFTLYSPELYAAQQEYLAALTSQRAAAATTAPDRADYLVRAARERLRLWDLSPGQIDRLAATGQPVERIPILSPASGYVVEKNVVEGAAVEPGMKLFRLAGLDRVWVEADLYESELGEVGVGAPAVVRFPNLPGEEYRGRVGFVYPWLDGDARTGRVRVELANPDLALKPDMYATVTFQAELGERLVVPEAAVLWTGERSFVFRDLGDGRIRPQRVETGLSKGEWVEITEGLSEGDAIVTSGNFLIAAESRLKLAMDRWR